MVTSVLPQDSPAAESFYRDALRELLVAEVPFLVGGASALRYHTGIERATKDFDIFVRPADVARVLAVLERAGYRGELTFPHWLGKVFSGDDFLDVIFSSASAISEVDDEWFRHAPEAQALDLTVKFCPAEETIWSKAFIMERERYDGADIAHILLAQGESLDWPRLLRRFWQHWRVLLSYLILFGFIYPGERDRVPDWVMTHLLDRLRRDRYDGQAGERVCQGTLLSWSQYLVDVQKWCYADARLVPRGNMTARDIAHWTAAEK